MRMRSVFVYTLLSLPEPVDRQSRLSTIWPRCPTFECNPLASHPTFHLPVKSQHFRQNAQQIESSVLFSFLTCPEVILIALAPLLPHLWHIFVIGLVRLPRPCPSAKILLQSYSYGTALLIYNSSASNFTADPPNNFSTSAARACRKRAWR